MASPTSPFVDHAAPVLAAEPAITDDQRAELWDTFHQSKDPNELAQKLRPIIVPDDLKHKLFQAKQAAAPAVPAVDKVTDVIKRIAQLDPQALQVAEAHPNVLKALTAAATTVEKPASGAAGGASAAGDGKTASGTKKPAAAALPPRADGQPHMPPIPDGHHRILASDGGIHDIPADKLDQARNIDPNLHVLNP